MATMFVKVSLCLTLLVVGSSGYVNKPIAQWLTDNGYTKLVSLLKATNLYDILDSKAKGPFTMFAPTDAAFASMPPTTLHRLESNPQVLTTWLQGHLVDGFLLAPLIRNDQVKIALNGQNLLFKKFRNNTVLVDGVRIISKDIIVNNGVVHGIDKPLIPATLLLGDGLPGQHGAYTYTTLANIMNVTGLEKTFTAGNITLFAPTDAAFQTIQSALPAYSSPYAKSIYTDILTNHVVSGTYYSQDLHDGQHLTTLHGQTVVVHKANGLQVDSETVVDPDILYTYGVIHGLNGVLVPQDLSNYIMLQSHVAG